jgi:hypothetical protein
MLLHMTLCNHPVHTTRLQGIVHLIIYLFYENHMIMYKLLQHLYRKLDLLGIVFLMFLTGTNTWAQQSNLDAHPNTPVKLTATNGFTNLQVVSSQVPIFGGNQFANLPNAINDSDIQGATYTALIGVGEVWLEVRDLNATSGQVFPAGTFAGMVYQNGSLIAGLDGVTITTYLDAAVRESVSSTSLIASPAIGISNPIVGFVTTQTYNRIRITFSSLAVGVNLSVFNAIVMKYAAGAPLVCNTPTEITLPEYPVAINYGRTGVSGLGVATVTSPEDVLSNVDTDYASLSIQAGAVMTASLSVKHQTGMIPVGTFAGFRIENTTLLDVTAVSGLTINTYKTGVAGVRESFSGSTLLLGGGALSGSGIQTVGFQATMDFDEIQISISNLLGIGLGETKVYNVVFQTFCAADPPLVCNVPTPLIAPRFAATVSSPNTGISGAASINSEIIDADALVDNISGNFAQISFAAGAFTNGFIAVKDHFTDYDSDFDGPYFVGFDIEMPSVLSAGVLNGTRVETYLNGLPTGEFVGNGSLIVGASSLLTGTGRQTLGFLATLPFDEVKLTIEQGASIDPLGSVKVFNAIITKYCASEVECDLTARTYPVSPVYINGQRTGIDAGACAACSINDVENIVNSAATEPATIYMPLNVGATARIAVRNAVDVYPAGSYAGFDIESTSLIDGNFFGSATIKLYYQGTLLASDPGDVTLGGVSSSLITSGSNRRILGIVGRAPFDEVVLEITSLASAAIAETKVYRMFVQNYCPTDFPPLCNFNTDVNNPLHGAVINANKTGVVAVACVGCEVNSPWNVVTPSQADYARITNAFAGGADASISVAVPNTVFPAGSFAGYTINKNDAILSGGFFSNITITTYLKGVQQEIVSDGNLVDFSFVLKWLGGTTATIQPGFYTTKPFDEVQISIASLVSALTQFVDVYNVIIDTRPAVFNGELACNLTNPDFNVTVAGTEVVGNLNTNDKVTAGTTYGTPTTIPGITNPSGDVPVVNADGTYTFTGSTPGVYQFEVPVCPPTITSGCPTELLTITVLSDTPGSTNPPVANTDIATTPFNTPVAINILANDKPGTPETALVPSSVSIIDLNGPDLEGVTGGGGSISINPATGAIIYTPKTGFIGKDIIQYTVCDDNSPVGCSSAYVVVTVNGPDADNSTYAADDYASTPVNTTLIVGAPQGVKANDGDAEGDAQIITEQPSTNIPGKGTLTLQTDGGYTFVPETGFTGPVDFVYETCDSNTPSVCTMATLHILVLEDEVLTPDLTPFITVDINDITHGNDDYVIPTRVRILNLNKSGVGPTTGTITVSIPTDAKFTITWDGSESFTHHVGSVANTGWTYAVVGGNHVWTTSSVINKGHSQYFGFHINVPKDGTTVEMPIQITISDGSGGESNNTNNVDVEILNCTGN